MASVVAPEMEGDTPASLVVVDAAEVKELLAKLKSKVGGTAGEFNLV